MGLRGHNILLNNLEECPQMPTKDGLYSFTTKIINEHDISVLCDLEASDYANLQFIIDTGAMASLIKYSHIRRGTQVVRDETRFCGLIKDQFVTSVGKLATKIRIGSNVTLNHTFFILNDEINLPNDGILGTDFLKKYNAKIDYLHDEMTFQFKLNFASFKVRDNMTNTDYVNPGIKADERTLISEESKLKQRFKAPRIKLSSIRMLRATQTKIMNEKTKSKKENNRNYYKNLSVEKFNEYPIKLLHSESISQLPLINSLFMGEGYRHDKGIFQVENDQIHMNGADEITSVRERVCFLKKNIDLSHCLDVELKYMNSIFLKFNKAFQLPGDKFRHSKVNSHHINIKPGTAPVFQRQFRVPEYHRSEMQRQLSELLKNKIIRPCDSPWNSPIFLVPKKANEKGEKQFRLVVNYHQLNKVIEPTSFPMPLIDEIIDKMHGCKYFSTLDLHGAFHQIPLDEESKPYTAFSTSWEKYCFNSVPFGLVSSPYAWCRAIHTVMREIIGNGAFVYMDDIIVYSKTLNHHIQILENIFDRFLKHIMKLKILE